MDNFHHIINNVFFTKKKLISQLGNEVHHLCLLQHGQLWVLVWVISESILGLFPHISAIASSFFCVFLTASTTSLILFSARSFLSLLKHRWKGHNTTITLHLLVLHVSPSSFALYLTLTVVEMTFCKCCVCKSNFSTTQPIARILWSVQCILVAFTGWGPALYISNWPSKFFEDFAYRK